MKIYVASSWRNAQQPGVVESLRMAGFDVYDFRHPSEDEYGFSWREIDEEYYNWTTERYIEILEHPIAERGFQFDFDAMKAADICVLVLPSGRSAHLEAGYFAGAGKKVFIYIPEKIEPELMYKMATGGIYSDFWDMLTAITLEAFKGERK